MPGFRTTPTPPPHPMGISPLWEWGWGGQGWASTTPMVHMVCTKGQGGQQLNCAPPFLPWGTYASAAYM